MARLTSDWQITFLPLLLAALILPQPASSAEPATTYTKDAIFYIPFHVDMHAAPSQQQVQLFVSGDQGRSWQLYQSKPLADERFLFRAGVDGEFWFAISSKSADEANSKIDEMQPELIVVLDRVAPAVEFTAELSPQREVALRYTIQEAHLADQGVQVEYRIGDDAPWTAVPTSPPLPAGSAGKWQGAADWPAGPQDPRIVRMTVTDRAGNTTVAQRPVELAAADVMDQAPPPVAGNDEVTQLPAINPPLSMPGSAPPTARGWQQSRATFAPPPLPGVTDTVVGGPAASPTVETVLPFDTERLSRSKRFQLEYEIDGQETLDIHRVEVWATNDRGQTWRHLGDDGDKRSPYLVTVPSDGVYGFRLLVQAQEGLPVRPPMNGDAPDVWVRVDTTPPMARITSARFGRGPTLGRLEIQWEVDDDDLTQSPVTLLFGDSPDGPWRIMADNLANEGYYSWQVDDRVPRDLYVRLEVQDRSGNIGSHTLDQPLRVDGLLPKGRIRNVRPTSATQPILSRRPIWMTE